MQWNTSRDCIYFGLQFFVFNLIIVSFPLLTYCQDFCEIRLREQMNPRRILEKTVIIKRNRTYIFKTVYYWALNNQSRSIRNHHSI